MDVVSALRLLARRRVLMAACLVAAVLIGAAASAKLSVGPLGSPAPHREVAYAQIQVDASTSILADVEAQSAALGTQAVLLAGLTPKRDVKAAIARIAGIAPGRLEVLTADARYPAHASPLATRAAEAAATRPAAYVLTIGASRDTAIIAVEASGPDRRVVRRLAAAPAIVLRSLAAATAPRSRHRLAVKALVPVGADERVEVARLGRRAGPPTPTPAQLAHAGRG